MTILVLLVHKTTELKVSRWEFRLFSEWKLSIFKTIIENADFLQHLLHISMYQVSRMLVFGNIRPSQPRAERSITNNWCMLKCTWSLVYPVASCQPNWYYWILTATWLFTFFLVYHKHRSFWFNFLQPTNCCLFAYTIFFVSF